jgi:hypothetical protein
MPSAQSAGPSSADNGLRDSLAVPRAARVLSSPAALEAALRWGDRTQLPQPTVLAADEHGASRTRSLRLVAIALVRRGGHRIWKLLPVAAADAWCWRRHESAVRLGGRCFGNRSRRAASAGARVTVSRHEDSHQQDFPVRWRTSGSPGTGDSCSGVRSRARRLDDGLRARAFRWRPCDMPGCASSANRSLSFAHSFSVHQPYLLQAIGGEQVNKKLLSRPAGGRKRRGARLPG